MNKKQTAIKMTIVPAVGTAIATATYHFIAPYISPEIWTGICVSVFVAVKDILKYKFKLF
jgi:hypothetical protein